MRREDRIERYENWLEELDMPTRLSKLNKN